MLVLRCLIIAVAVVGIMGDELTLSDVIVKMTEMERKIQNLEQQIEGISSNFVSLFVCLIK